MGAHAMQRMTVNQKLGISGRMLRAVGALLVAELIMGAVATATFMPDRQVAQRQAFPVSPSIFPVAPGDTIADRVLGQMDFSHNSGNFVDASTLSIGILAATGVAVDR